MPLPADFDLEQCIPTEEDFETILNAKKTGQTWQLLTKVEREEASANGDNYRAIHYPEVRYFIVAMLLDWEDMAREAESRIFYNSGGNYDKQSLRWILDSIIAPENLHKFSYLYKKYKDLNVPNPKELVNKAADARKGNIEVNVKNPNGGFFRIIEYSMKYTSSDPTKTQSGARMHLFLNKKVSGDTWGISVRGSNLFNANRTEWDEPFFATEQEARDFIANIDNSHIPTAVDLSNWRFVISDKPVKYAWDQDTREYIKKADLIGAKKINTICGPCYMLDKCRFFEGLEKKYTLAEYVLDEDLEEDVDIEEDIEKHETLNPVLFEGNKLKPEVREKLIKIANVFIEGLAEDGIKFNLKDIVLIGSNASYNYTKDSDIDLHLLAETGSLNCPDNLYPLLYGAYRALFNKKFDIDFYGIKVELYVEPEGTATVSNGIYSVLKDNWIKEPVQVDIPEINMEEFNKEFQPWESRYNDLVARINAANTTAEYTALIAEIETLIADIYEQRRMGIAISEYDQKNLLFKEFRNRGYLDNLKDLKCELKSKELSLPDKAAPEAVSDFIG